MSIYSGRWMHRKCIRTAAWWNALSWRYRVICARMHTIAEERAVGTRMTLSRVDRLKARARAMGVDSGVGIYTHFWRRKCIEPIKRKCGGNGPQWVVHRFEIKGGISFRDALIYDMMLQPNRFIVKGPDGELCFRDIPVRIVEAA